MYSITMYRGSRGVRVCLYECVCDNFVSLPLTGYACIYTELSFLTMCVCCVCVCVCVCTHDTLDSLPDYRESLLDSLTHTHVHTSLHNIDMTHFLIQNTSCLSLPPSLFTPPTLQLTSNSADSLEGDDVGMGTKACQLLHLIAQELHLILSGIVCVQTDTHTCDEETTYTHASRKSYVTFIDLMNSSKCFLARVYLSVVMLFE